MGGSPNITKLHKNSPHFLKAWNCHFLKAWKCHFPKAWKCHLKTIATNTSPVNQALRGDLPRTNCKRNGSNAVFCPKVCRISYKKFGVLSGLEPQTFYMLFRGLKENALSKKHFCCNLFYVQLCTDWTILLMQGIASGYSWDVTLIHRLYALSVWTLLNKSGIY